VINLAEVAIVVTYRRFTMWRIAQAALEAHAQLERDRQLDREANEAWELGLIDLGGEA
jgi:hypothetical protein